MKKKVLHIITRLDAGGSSTNTIETVARLNKDKYDVELVAGKTHDPNGQIQKSLQEKNIGCMFVDEMRRELSVIYDVKAFFKLCKIIRNGHYDIVHTHSSKAGILGRWASRLCGTRIIVHTPHGHVFYGYFGKFKTFVFIVAEKITAFLTDRIITLTDIGKYEHIQFKIAPADKFQTIYSGISIEQFSVSPQAAQNIRSEFNLSADCFLFGTVARLDPIKGNEFLIEALAELASKYQNVRLLIAGEGDQREYLENKCRTLGIQEKVIFAGYRNDVAEILSAIDVFVLVSLNEGMGRVVLEAMAAGLPVIATRTGGVPELVDDQRDGILVPTKDSQSIASAMEIFLCDKTKVKEFGERGRLKVNQRFSVEKMVEDIDALYQRLINQKSK